MHVSALALDGIGRALLAGALFLFPAPPPANASIPGPVEVFRYVAQDE